MEDVLAAAETLGLSRISDALSQDVLESLRIDLRPLDGGQGRTTRFGGEPDLPPDLEWPSWDSAPLIFVAQLALSDIGPTAVAGELPPDGVLSFWYAGSEKAWGFDPREHGASRVFFFPSGTELRTRPQQPGLPDEGPLRACTWSTTPELTIPPWESPTVEAWQLTKQERERYFDLQDWLRVGDDVAIHRLLGHPEPVQDDMRLECQLVTNGLYCGDATGYEDPRAEMLSAGAADWRLLLQIDSDEKLGSEWGDAGRVYFWIRKQDLAAERFDAAWHIMQCA